MPQVKKGDRAKGPYREPAIKPGRPAIYPGRWVVITLTADDPPKRTKESFPFETPGQEESQRLNAQNIVDATNQEFELAQGVTIEEAMEAYPAWLLRTGWKRPNRQRSVDTIVGHLLNFFPEEAKLLPDKSIVDVTSPKAGKVIYPRRVAVADLTSAFCEALYERLKDCSAGDTAVNTMNDAKRFLRFCAEKKKWARSNPLAGFSPPVNRNPGGKGKDAQLTFNQLAVWEAKAFELAEAGDRGAVAALIALKLQLRTAQLVARKVQDVDMDGAIFRALTDGKNRPSEQLIPVLDERLRVILMSLKIGRNDEEWLFPGEREYAGGTGHRNRGWVTAAVKRICRAAGVPETTHAHAMRGAGSSLDHISGETLDEVQRKLGHEIGSSVTKASYLTPEAIFRARQKKLMKAIKGGTSR